ncbi:zinc finger BED domain-containing protein 4-like [Aphis craccivora]|uniref:Zinc finger BED domain-containing protein 4-like n=1 Tax=Aphis craccivora TaxID=307492 RepID=A0A6G0YL53_APHCR|nr:zinc finger BED domain-containing protein 4-like [Aphis craccivora]
MRTEKNIPLDIYSMILKMEEKAQKRFSGMEDNSTFAEATLIDPRFSSETYYIRTYQNVVSKISSIIKHKRQSINQEENIVTDEEQITMSTEKKETFEMRYGKNLIHRTDTSDAIVELDIFLNEPLIPRKSDPLIGSALTSVPCKRMFSKAGYTQTDRRNRLSIKNMKTLINLLDLFNLQVFNISTKNVDEFIFKNCKKHRWTMKYRFRCPDESFELVPFPDLER